MIYLHEHQDFKDLLLILEDQMKISSTLIEKDYWIMHILYGLKKQGYKFELKGGTSLSKGLKIIDRFSEDIDIRIEPPADLKINEKSSKPNAISKRRDFYDYLAHDIKIDGITGIERDTEFDSHTYMSGGIRLFYDSQTEKLTGLKQGILLEVGFDQVSPNSTFDISSWAFNYGNSKIEDLIDNTAYSVICYDHRYTFVEKLQTIITKYRREKESGIASKNYLRQYYDIYCLLGDKQVQDFIGTDDYKLHVQKRFPGIDQILPINKQEALFLNDKNIREELKKRYNQTSTLYYKGQPDFDIVLERIAFYLSESV